jgi:molecular chaperone GrpE (heat shock protein)
VGNDGEVADVVHRGSGAQIDSDKEEGVVVQVIQAGYAIGDRLIRPALVGVAKSKA